MMEPEIENLPSVALGLLQLARIKSGLSQRELALRAGIPTSMVSAYERDRRRPTLPTLIRLLKAAGFEPRIHLEPYNAADAPGTTSRPTTVDEGAQSGEPEVKFVA